ncbi:hypothetical protein RB195_004257 [Necator americanus]|uniref:Secreted protein n=1 Tax=Necator americanus TaxID=51031 RepID=A0ABR1BKL0_NECAM
MYIYVLTLLLLLNLSIQSAVLAEECADATPSNVCSQKKLEGQCTYYKAYMEVYDRISSLYCGLRQLADAWSVFLSPQKLLLLMVMKSERLKQDDIERSVTPIQGDQSLRPWLKKF